MKTLLITASAAALTIPLAATPAAAQSRNYNQELRECNRELRQADSRAEYRRELNECRRELTRARNSTSRNYNQELRECNRELRRADNRAEYRRELRECRRELNRAQRQDWRRYSRYDWNRYEPGSNRYYADRYYRSGSYYQDRRLTRYDRIYRGQNGRYYCRRSDGTTGLIIGAGIGALIGNRIDAGGSATVSTIIGGAAGGILGRAIDRGQVRCD